MKRTAIYIRVSSEKQVQEGDSIAAQRDALHKYIDNRPDLTCTGEFLDDGISGQKIARDALQSLLDAVERGEIDLIIFTKLDRWFRSVRHYTATQEVLDRHNVGWLAIWEPIYDTTTPSGRLIVNQMMSIAQFEAENTGQRIRQVQAYKVTQGEVISGSVPFGYRIKGKHLVPDHNADAARNVFEYYSVCGSIKETMLNAWAEGMPRTQNGFKSMLMNQKYTGSFRGNDNFCTPIISKELFDDVQRKLKINVKVSQKRTYIFSGLIRCGECGLVLAGNTRTRAKGRIINPVLQYRCPGHFCRPFKTCDNTKIANERVLERYLMDNIRPMIKDIVLSYEVEQGKQRDTRSRIKNAQTRIDRLKELYINGLIGLEEYKADRERLETQLAEIEEPEPVKDMSYLVGLLDTDIESLYWGMSPEEKRYFWRSIIKEIRFGKDRQIKIDFL